MSLDDALDVAALRHSIGRQLLGNRIELFDETTSTNDVVAQMACSSDEGLVVFAEHQTAGRGQYGRSWESATRKGLWFSMLLRPRIAVAESSRLTHLLAHAIGATIDQTIGEATSVKPPNDVYLGS